MKPEQLKYTRTHEWASYDAKANIVTVGISAFACQQLGDIVYVELPEAGTQVSQDQPFGVIESVKAAVDLNCPVSGRVVEANAAATQGFDLITNTPYADGWMIKVTPSDPSELDGLMDAAAYEKFTAEEAGT